MIGHEARKPNPALMALQPLVGVWGTTGTHPLVPGKTFHGKTSFEWIEGGAFLLMRSEIDEPEIPSGIAIFGSDDASGELFMTYFDERDVSRKYDVAIDGNRLRCWRNSPAFSQRMALTISDDGKTMHSQGEMSRDGGDWEPDLQLTYSKTVS